MIYFTTKPEVDMEDFKQMKPLLIVVFGYFLQFCAENKINPNLTHILGDLHVSKSRTHSEGRAFDVSTRGWTAKQIDDCIVYMNDKVGHLGAYSASDGKQRVIVRHDAGMGDHFHCQIKP